MVARYATAVLAFVAASAPAFAEYLNADAARRFATGKLFAFSCFDGSRGAGRVYPDGSVSGTIQFQGSGPVRTASLPPGTLKVRGESVCASVKALPIEACFELSRTGDQSFRGSISGLSSAYCDFTRRPNVAFRKPRMQPAKPLSLDLARWSPVAP
jgi:hypothetical protein